MLLENFILLLVIAFGVLGIAAWRKSVVFSLFSFVLFAGLTFSAYNIEVISGTGVMAYGTDIMLVYITWGMTFVSFIVMLLGMIKLLTDTFRGTEE